MSDFPADMPPSLFERADESPDGLFYDFPRLVTHVDDITIETLRAYYGETLSPGSTVLDLMSSWISHLPENLALSDTLGLGMNATELAENAQLSEFVVHDLNAEPELPFASERFDAVLNAFSIQYLTQPIAVMRSVNRILKPGGRSIVAMSHRCFPTKAIRGFQYIDGPERMRLVARYHEQAGNFSAINEVDRSPPHGDPLWIVTATKRH
ncbi:MAG: methyltransferase domain-containing protein [Gammaproteobacteria bacterium]|nr:methyltransferase domain-containing protein [Gammaproteobacteria bacterium]